MEKARSVTSVLLVCLMAVALLSGAAHATVYFQDSFEYNSWAEMAATGWTQAGGTANDTAIKFVTSPTPVDGTNAVNFKGSYSAVVRKYMDTDYPDVVVNVSLYFGGTPNQPYDPYLFFIGLKNRTGSRYVLARARYNTSPPWGSQYRTIEIRWAPDAGYTTKGILLPGWNTIQIAYKGSVATFYLNGVQIDQKTNWDTGGGLYMVEIGRSGTAGTNYDVVLDHLKISDTSIIPYGAEVKLGNTQQFTSDSPNTPIGWTVDNPSVGQIDSSSGLFTAVGSGNCQVTATDSLGATDTAYVVVPSLVVTPATATVPTRGTQQFALDPSRPADWQVVNESTPGIGTIDSSNGLFTAGTVPGTCQVRAIVGGATIDSGTITVVAPVITPSPARVVLGNTAQFTCSPSVGSLTWSIVGGGSSVGTIDSTSGVFTPVAPGTCQVSVTDSVGNTDIASVTVVAPGAYRYEPDFHTLGLWHLDEASGQAWYDSSGNNITGNTSQPPLNHLAGLFGNAAGGFTKPAFIATAVAPVLTTEELTAEAWIYYPEGTDPQDTQGKVHGILSHRPTANLWSFMLGGPYGGIGGAGTLTFYWWGVPAGDGLASENLNLQTNKWYHVAVTFKRINNPETPYEVKLYCTPEGATAPVEVASKTTANSLRNANSQFLIGTEGGALDRIFPGYIDEVRVSSKGRTPEELSWNLGAYPAGKVADPQIAPGGGNCVLPQYVTITCATPDVTIYYTTDGIDPDLNSAVYGGTPIKVSQDTTIKAMACKSNLISGYAKAKYVFPKYNRPRVINYTNTPVVVDGDLADWADAEWTPLDQNYSGDPADIAEAYYAAKWGDSGSKVYVAVRVMDTAPVFTDGWTASNVRDAAEFYIHTTGTGPVAYSATQADAQQYSIGFNASGMPFEPTIWSCIGTGLTYPAGALVGAGKIFTDELAQMWYYYEAAITPYHHFTLDGSDLQVSTLSAGQMIGLDVVAASYNSGTFGGMKAENLLTGKWNDYTKIAQHLLVGQEPNATIAQVKQAADNTILGVSGIVSAVFSDYFYIESPDRTYGIQVYKPDHGRAVGDGVTVYGMAATLFSTERCIYAIHVTPNGSGEIKPLAMTNLTIGGGNFGTPPAGQAGVANGTGLNNIGLLVTVTGKVQETKGSNWFAIDDGSGVGIKVYGTVPSATPYVTVKGICSCEKDTAGNVQRVILETEKLENVP